MAYAGSSTKSIAEQALAYFRKALEWQPDMPNAFLGMSWVFGQDLSQPDSAEYYARLAAAVAPTWVLPYVRMSEAFSSVYGRFEKAKQFLDMADRVDSSSVLVRQAWALYYFSQKEYPDAERELKKIVASLEGTVCLPCAQNQLGEIYLLTGRMAEAEALIKKLLEADSTNFTSHLTLGKVFTYTGRFAEAEQEFKKVAIFASYTSSPEDIFNYNMVIVYAFQNQMDKAFESLEKSLVAGNTDYDWMQIDPDLANLRALPAWKDLMKKHFPDKVKD